MVAHQQFNVKEGEFFILTALPNKNSFDTKFSFSYSLEGTILPWYEWYYNQMFLVPENGTLFLYGGGVMVVILLTVLICCCFVCLRKVCKRKRDKIDPYDTLELTVQDYEKQKAK